MNAVNDSISKKDENVKKIKSGMLFFLLGTILKRNLLATTRGFARGDRYAREKTAVGGLSRERQDG